MKYGVDLTMIETMQRAEEAVGQNEMKNGYGHKEKVKAAVTLAFRHLRLSNQVEGIYKQIGRETWEIHFDGELNKNQREAVVDLVAKNLGKDPKSIILFGLYPKKK